MARKQTAEISLTPEQLRRLQLVELDILLEVDRVCRKNDISYFLCGGTLLGGGKAWGIHPLG